MYVPLWVKSHCSFLEGASSPEELVSACAAAGYGALALTDRDGVYGAVRAMVAARDAGIRLLVGAEVRVTGAGRLVLLAADREGYGNLCRLLTVGHRVGQGGRCPPFAPAVVAAAAEGLIALLPAAPTTGGECLREGFGDRLYGLVTRQAQAEDYLREASLRRWAGASRVQLAAGMEVLYHERSRRPLQDVLRCIAAGRSLRTAGTLLAANDRHALPLPSEVQQLFRDAPELVARTCEIADRCQFDLGGLRYCYPAEGELGLLHELTQAGALRRYPDGVPTAVRQQLAHELGLIEELGYCGYFLTMHEIVDWCRQQGILCQGRGSAANSAVCYCLGITAVDPVRMELLFERFLSRERHEPPDIDLDIEHDRRELVIQHVYEKYGRSHAALTAMLSRFRSKSALREVGKVFELPPADVARMAALAGHGGGFAEPNAELLRQAGLNPDVPWLQIFLARVGEILDVPRHLATHPGGFVLGQEPLHRLCPIQPAAMPGRTILQWDKDDLENLKIFKVDLLGLGALSHLRRCFDLLEVRDGRRLAMRDLPLADEAVFQMLERGDTVGVFQVESRAQMAMLPRLKPRVWYDLVIQISIIRPGPIVGGMVHPYLRRRQGVEPVSYPHALLEPVLRKTLGVPLFQEQVMKVAMIAADYTPGEADQLRRDMAAWRRHGRLEGHQRRLLERMQAKGISAQFAQQVFDQISGFGEYGFPESHAASFALIAWAASWLRCHEPAVFLCALLNSQPMGFYSPATLIEDARRHEVPVLPVDVNTSDWDCTIEVQEGRAGVRMGLRYVRGLQEEEGRRLLARRGAAGFASMTALRRDGGLGAGVARLLARAGALDGLDGHRRRNIWASWQEWIPPDGLALELADVQAEFTEMNDGERVCADYQFSGHSTLGHPLAAMRAGLTARGLPVSSEVRSCADGTRLRYAGLVICRQQPATAKGIVFLTMEDEAGFVNVLIHIPVHERYRTVLAASPLLGVSGVMQSRDGVSHLIAEELWAV